MVRVGIRPTAIVGFGPTCVVRHLMTNRARHPPTAPAEDHAAQNVSAKGLRMNVEIVVSARTTPRSAARVQLVVHPLWDQRLMGRLERPDPLDRVVDFALFGPARAPVEDLVSGVLRVPQDFIDAGLSPRFACPPAAGRLRRRVALQVSIEPVSDLAVSKLFVVAPVRDLRDRLGSNIVALQAALRVPLGGLRRVRMRDDLRLVPVWRLADVEALADVSAQAAPRLFEGVEYFVFGDGLINPPLKYPLRSAARESDGLVGGEQRNISVL